MAGEHFHEIKGYGPNELDSALRSVLKPGERVVWKGRHRVAHTLTPFLIWLFAIPWTGFALFWVMSTWALANQAPPADPGLRIVTLVFPAFGLPFVAIGIGMMVAPFFAYSLPGRTLFAVTDRRFLRIAGGWKTSLRAIPGEWVLEVDCQPQPDGSGTLTILASDGPGPAARMKRRNGVDETTRMRVPHLPNVRDAARAVEQMRLSCAASSQSAGPSR